jgi:putative hydrolase
MSDHPFGFGTPSGGDDDSGEQPGGSPQPVDPFSMMFGGGNPGDVGAAFQRLGQLLSWTGGPVNWDLARDVARQTAATSNDPSIGDGQRRQVEEAVRLAEHWLDAQTSLPAATTRAEAWSRAQWIEETLPVWRVMIDPVAGRVVDAMGAALSAQAPPEMAAQTQALAGPLTSMMRSLGGAMFGAQVGQALGSLAGEVVGSTDVGVPLTEAGRAALLPTNVAAFGEGLGVSDDEVRLFLALREAAHHRLFAQVSWLRPRLLAEIEAYAKGISIDTSKIEEAVTQVDMTNPAALQEALQSGLLEPAPTDEQRTVLARLEVLLALVEGWVDEVVAGAASTLPDAARLRETVRRRRATGGPAEQTFASLVGLELRPRRLREAAALWHALGEARGIDGRDAVWAHPDLLPSGADLDDPEAFVAGSAELDLSALLDTPPVAEEAADPEQTPPDADETDR